jgi:hypothetical protein
MTSPTNPERAVEVVPSKCPWGCTPQLITKTIPGPEPNFPDRERPVIFCEHARIEGEKGLVVGADDWCRLIARWNTRHRTASEARVQEGEAVLVPRHPTEEMISEARRYLFQGQSETNIEAAWDAMLDAAALPATAPSEEMVEIGAQAAIDAYRSG